MLKENKFVHVVSNLVIGLMLTTLISFTLVTMPTYATTSVDTEAIYYGNKESSNVSLMVNVYWGTEYLDDMLRVFESYDITTTFFVGGQWVEKEPEMLKKIVSLGHEIGNHGFFHRDHDKLSYDQNLEEISVCHKLVESVCGVNMKLFAPPSGAYNKTTLEVARDLGYKTIMWSRDTIDWRDHDDNLIYNRAINVSGGDFVLMHPTENTRNALENIIKNYNERGLKVTTVSEVLKV